MSLKMPCGILERWALLLQQYDFEITHRAGVSNGNADALPRPSYDPIVAAIDNPGVQVDRVHYLQRQDPALADIIDYLEYEVLPTSNKTAKPSFTPLNSTIWILMASCATFLFLEVRPLGRSW